MKSREEIMQVAKELFLEHGYRKVSMRMIAARCQMSHTLTYHYFESKEALFTAIVQPIVFSLQYVRALHNQHSGSMLAPFTDPKLRMIDEYTTIVTHCRSELSLLLQHAQDTPYAHYVEEYIESYVETGKEYFRTLRQQYPQLRTTFSPIIVRITAREFINLLHSLLDEQLTDAERRECIVDYMNYSYAGWEALMQIPTHNNSLYE